MSGIVLSASVRQNLLSLQSTADLLATTQNRLATGKKVNTALDNPTNYLHRAVARCPRQRHQQPARRHRQRRAGPAGRQHRHHLAAEAGRYREVDRQPGAADHGRLLHQVERVGDDHRRDRDRPARHHDLHQRDRVRNVLYSGAAGGTTARLRHDARRRVGALPAPRSTRRPPRSNGTATPATPTLVNAGTSPSTARRSPLPRATLPASTARPTPRQRASPRLPRPRA